MYQYFPIVVIAGAVALYHLSSKLLSGGHGNPWGALALTYLLSCLVCVALAFILPGTVPVKITDLKASLPIAFLLGLACVGIEGGYLLAYGFGWNVTHLFSLTSFVNTLAIFAVGLVFFKEAFATQSFVGLALVLVGVSLVHWR